MARIVPSTVHFLLCRYVLLIMAVQSIVFFIVAWYLNQVTDQGTGMKRHWLFFLNKPRKAASIEAATATATQRASSKKLLVDQP